MAKYKCGNCGTEMEVKPVEFVEKINIWVCPNCGYGSDKIIISIEEWKKMLMYRTPIRTYVTEVSFIGELLGRTPKKITMGGHKHPIIEAMCYNPKTNRREVFGRELMVKKV